ncbi:class I SAM-dependent methyltransferase [Globicatella sanguinis]|uniref:class I SAM-dependent methyltransferase n=1 Tax=Globicatella sanguinis TaxID=13076 RepID=UPI000825BFAA|nr:class I SAM-dependent methyltransferase [Globicatella sanguinis]
MSNQYFENNEHLDHNVRTIQFQWLNFPLIFKTDSGVFSKNQVDYGSKVLLEAVVEDLSSLLEGPIVELGSGYGPIAISLAKSYPKIEVIGVEINQRAQLLSQDNAKLNQVSNCTFIHHDATTVTLKKSAQVVVTNPPIRAGKAVIQAFVKQAHQILQPNGILYVVIQKKQGAPSMAKYMERLFDNVEKITQDKGYWILKSVK